MAEHPPTPRPAAAAAPGGVGAITPLGWLAATVLGGCARLAGALLLLGLILGLIAFLNPVLGLAGIGLFFPLFGPIWSFGVARAQWLLLRQSLSDIGAPWREPGREGVWVSAGVAGIPWWFALAQLNVLSEAVYEVRATGDLAGFLWQVAGPVATIGLVGAVCGLLVGGRQWQSWWRGAESERPALAAWLRATAVGWGWGWAQLVTGLLLWNVATTLPSRIASLLVLLASWVVLGLLGGWVIARARRARG